MDCEKFEPLLLDELYDELDEVTSAALKRHVAACARCASALSAMRHTQELVELPVVELPDDLEERIFARTREAQKVVPLRSRASRALSLAGRWAMRPQTATAAVFLLMVGSSAFFLRTRTSAGPQSAVSVTVAGEPGSSLAAADHDSLDDQAAAAAHGAGTPKPPAVAMPTTPAAPEALANAEPAGALAQASAGTDDEARKGEGAAAGHVALGRAAQGANAELAQAEAPPGSMPKAATTETESKRAAGDVTDPFAAGMAAYRARNYAEATRQFDVAAKNGNASAALWAAKSVRDESGCVAALERFDALATSGAGTWTGSEAAFEGASCRIATGQVDAGREAMARLAQVPSHKARAQAALDELTQVAARRSAAKASAGAAAAKATAKPAAAAPAKAAPSGE